MNNKAYIGSFEDVRQIMFANFVRQHDAHVHAYRTQLAAQAWKEAAAAFARSEDERRANRRGPAPFHIRAGNTYRDQFGGTWFIVKSYAPGKIASPPRVRFIGRLIAAHSPPPPIIGLKVGSETTFGRGGEQVGDHLGCAASPHPVGPTFLRLLP